MKINIDPEMEFSTGAVASMLGIEGLTSSRIKMLCNKGLVPHTRTSERGHHKIKFKDFEQVVVAHEQVRSVNRGQKVPTMEQFRDLESRVDELHKEVKMIGDLYDLNCAPDITEMVQDAR